MIYGLHLVQFIFGVLLSIYLALRLLCCYEWELRQGCIIVHSFFDSVLNLCCSLVVVAI